ncbi:hypothetical protein [uncultured Algoriphagus sp.]|uniref:hypothetical protein n=1 Tax=uncultured Algoriphagus sp. TaxID=417365 RepID=UPI0030ED39E9|tara:strand:- start:592 stop:1116 length:525 start_codon:yes stop_codon:yes gene_type:complete
MTVLFLIDASIPDWIQAIGAVVAAIGLVWTLILQRKTLKEQQVITQLDRQRYLDSFRPAFDFENLQYSKDGQNRKVTFIVRIIENSIQNLKITHNFPDVDKIVIPNYIEDVILPKGYSFPFEMHFTFSEVFLEIEVYSGNSIIFEFEDIFGNKYLQALVYKGSENLFMHPAHRI